MSFDSWFNQSTKELSESVKLDDQGFLEDAQAPVEIVFNAGIVATWSYGGWVVHKDGSFEGIGLYKDQDLPEATRKEITDRWQNRADRFARELLFGDLCHTYPFETEILERPENK